MYMCYYKCRDVIKFIHTSIRYEVLRKIHNLHYSILTIYYFRLLTMIIKLLSWLRPYVSLKDHVKYGISHPLYTYYLTKQ